MKHHLYLFSLLFTLLHVSQSARILALLPIPLWSHYMQFEPLLEALAARGHHLSVYSPYPPKTNLTNFHHVTVDLKKSKDTLSQMNHFQGVKEGTYGEHSFKGHLQSTIFGFNLGIGMVQEIFNNSEIQDLMASNEKFDLVFAEVWFGQEALVVFGHKFKAPVIGQISYGTPHNVYKYMGNPNLPSFMPDYKFAFSPTMNFLERLQNTILGVFTHLMGDLWYYPEQDRRMREFSTNPTTLPDIQTQLKNVSTTFIYSDIMLESPRPQVSNLVHVGGIHLKKQPLPEELEDLMSTKLSPKGVIYVAFGSLINPTKMPSSMRDHLVKAFSRTGLTVLWRWGDESNTDLPPNVHLRSWLPQQAILAHPNCRLFISHGGVNSVLEAIHYAVPMVGIPFYGDQPSNIKHLVDLGMGLELSFFNITEESIAWATNTVLNNRSYKHAALQASRRFNDRQNSPLDTAVWWVEYVLRHHGAPHLRSAFDNLSWTEFLFLDVLAFVLGVLLIILYILLRILRVIKFIIRYPFASSNKTTLKKAKKT